MFAVERYVTSALLAVLDQYVEDLDPKDAQVSLWTGGVALHNLVLRPNMIRRALSLPVTVSSGRIHELLVSVPWMKIVSEPVVVTINTMECVLSLNEEPVAETRSEIPTDQPENRDTNEQAVEEMPPGYVAALVQRVVSNITVRVHRLILKLVEDDTVLSLNIESLQLNSADAQWNPAFIDVEASGVMRRIVHLRDLTLCLDRCSAAGTIRDYQEPLLYRCDLLFRVTRQRSSTRTACTHIALECEKLLFGVSRAQLPMLHRLVMALAVKRAAAAAAEDALARTRSRSAHLIVQRDDSVESSPLRQEEGWSAWAWSWVPGWGTEQVGSESGASAAPARPPRASLLFTFIVHHLTFSFKIAERTESGAAARRMRGVLRLSLERAALAFRSRTKTDEAVTSLRLGAKRLCIESEGSCACGKATVMDQRESYVRCSEASEQMELVSTAEEEAWPALAQCDLEVEEEAEAAAAALACPAISLYYLRQLRQVHTAVTDLDVEDEEAREEETREEEECEIEMTLGEMELIVCAGLLHRLKALADVYFPPRAQPEIVEIRSVVTHATTRRKKTKIKNSPMPRPYFTIDKFIFNGKTEQQAVDGGGPLRRARLTWRRPRLSLLSLDHAPAARYPLHLRLETALLTAETSEPLYSYRDSPGVSAHRRLVIEAYDARALLVCSPCAPFDTSQESPVSGCSQSRAPVARLTVRVSATWLLDPHPPNMKEPVLAAYTLRIKEGGVCGSAARLRAACLLLSAALSTSPATHKAPALISDSFAHQALHDRDAVHLDTAIEEALLRSYQTQNVRTVVLVLEGIRATVLRALPHNNTIEQAWIFSAPDISTTSPFLRAALQYCAGDASAPQFAGAWCEPASASLDPLLMAWLAGWNLARSNVRAPDPAPPPEKSTAASSSQHSHQIHKRSEALSRSHSSGERETPPPPPPPQTPAPTVSWEAWLATARCVCASAELGPLTLYAPTESVSALDCPSLHAAIERHVIAKSHDVIVFSVGRLNAHSNSSTNAIWRAVRQDGPTVMSPDSELLALSRRDSFPWKVHADDAWCYTLSAKRPSDAAPAATTSRLKYATHARTILERLSTGLTFSVITEMRSEPESSVSADDAEKAEYFASGQDFEPKTLHEFVHGPSKETKEKETGPKIEAELSKMARSRMLGVCVHMDTSPVIVEIRSEQIGSLFSTIHSISHLLESQSAPPPPHPAPPLPPQHPGPTSTTASRSAEWNRATTEPSGACGSSAIADQSDLIYEKPQTDWRVTVWVQWVLARVTVRYRLSLEKLVLDVEELSVSFDLQKDYCQYKVKASGAEISVMERKADARWHYSEEAGGRVLRARDATPTPTAKGLLALTVTAATSTSIRSKWSYDLSIPPVPLETVGRNARSRSRKKEHTVWEVALRLAPLDIALNAHLLSRFAVASTVAIKLCTANAGGCAKPTSQKMVPHRPLIYVDWSGVQILLPVTNKAQLLGHHDVVIFEIQHVTVNPNPENPICRQPLRPDVSAARGVSAWWEHTTDRQYSLLLYGVAAYTAAWDRLEGARVAAQVAHDNPARAWRAVGSAPAPTPLLHPAPLHAVLAPGTVLFAAATEISLPEDVHVHICVPQIRLFTEIAKSVLYAAAKVNDVTKSAEYKEEVECTYQAATAAMAEATRDTGPLVKADSGCCCDSIKEETSARHTPILGQQRATQEEIDGNGEVYVTARALHMTLYELRDKKAAALVHARLTQPTVFMSRRTASNPVTNTTTKYQMSLYNVWVGCAHDYTDARSPECTDPHHLDKLKLPDAEACPLALLDTGRGTPDPVTYVRPALLTLDVQTDNIGGSGRVRVRAAVERPVRLQLCEERARRIYNVRRLLSESPLHEEPDEEWKDVETVTNIESNTKSTMLENMHQRLSSLDNVQITTQQLVVRLAKSEQEKDHEGLIVGLISLEAQLCARSRPNSIVLRALIKSLAASGPADVLEDSAERLYLLHPFTFGLQTTVIWEHWRRTLFDADSPDCYALRTLVEGGCVTIEAAPRHIDLIRDTQHRLNDIFQIAFQPLQEAVIEAPSGVEIPQQQPLQHHVFKDDLRDIGDDSIAHIDSDMAIPTFLERNGAFKVSADLRDPSAVPLAYQVIIGQDSVMWRYPQPRTLTRVLVYPLPLLPSDQGTTEHLSVAVEWFCEVTGLFQQIGYLTLHDTNTVEFFASLHQCCWSETWRVRLCSQSERETGAPLPQHVAATFTPAAYGLASTPNIPAPTVGHMGGSEGGLTHALAGALRVDSCQSERSVSRLNLSGKMMAVDVRVRTALALHSRVQLLRKSRTALKLFTTDITLHFRLAPVATTIAAQFCLRAFLLEPTTMQTRLVVGPVELRALLRRSDDAARVRAHMDTLPVSFAPHHLHLLRRLLRQWLRRDQVSNDEEHGECSWVQYRLHNRTERSLRVGQEGTREGLLLAPGERLAYAWRSTRAPRRLCVTLTERHPSTGVELDIEGRRVVALEANTQAYVTADTLLCGAVRVSLAGSLHLANTLPLRFLYKVRVSAEGGGGPRTMCAGSLPPQSTDTTVLCPDTTPDTLFIKLKLADWDTGGSGARGGWTGDVPLRECPDGKAPWLVKVPCHSEHEFVCVWGRTVRSAPPDTRLLLMLWPLYVLNSELPLELVMKATSESRDTELLVESAEQLIKGRGVSTAMMLPGTTHTKHHLTFRYRDVETRVTRDTVPLHYSLATELVLEKPVAPDIDVLLHEVKTWLLNQCRAANADPASYKEEEEDWAGGETEGELAWPYSVVTRHRAGEWIASPLPPHTLFTVEYKRVRAGGAGCALELQVQPHGLFCNATPKTLTLRSRDFLHLCTTLPGHVVAPPHNFPMEDGWTVSYEPDKETRWMSIGISVAQQPRGVYEQAPPGEVARDHPAHLHILSPTRDQVALFSLYYELRRGMGILGVSSSHLVRNLTTDTLLVCGMAIWSGSGNCSSVNAQGDEVPVRLWPREYVSLPPHSHNSAEGFPLDVFSTQSVTEDMGSAGGHWRKYVCLKLLTEDEEEAENEAVENKETLYVPVRLDKENLSRRTIALRAPDQTYRTYCVTVQRLRKELEGRTVVEVGEEKHSEFVVCNHTNIPLLLGATAQGGSGEAEEECAGARWQRSLPPHATLAYSTPAYSERLARADPDLPPLQPVLMLTACHLSCDIQWGRVEVSRDAGEALLVRVAQDLHVKVTCRRRARHTLITVHHVAPHDVSARDIRQRLQSGAPSASTDSAHTSTELPLSVSCEQPATKDSQEAESTCSTPRILTQEDWDMEDACEQTEGSSAWSCRIAVRSASLQLCQPPYDTAIMILYLDRSRLAVLRQNHSMHVQLSVSELQADNPQSINSNSFDFPVLLAGHGDKDEGVEEEARPPLWAVEVPPADAALARLIVHLSMRVYTFKNERHSELCQVEVHGRQLALYVEDRYLVALLSYMELLRTSSSSVEPSFVGTSLVPRETILLSAQLREPLCARLVRLHQLPLLLSLHTSTWLYVALDHSPITLAEYERRDLATRNVQLLRSLAYHYLSGAIFGAGWVVGGLEALGAPGTLVRRVGEGVRALAAGGGATALCGSLAAGALESLAALCNSFARNLDLLAGDEEHRVRAEAQRRRRPRSLAAALAAGLYNLASSLAGSVGGLARNSFATPRAALVGAFTKPISATADLVALSSQGLLSQAGWDLRPQPRALQPCLPGVYGTGDEVATVGGERAVYCCRVQVHGHASPMLLLFTTERLVVLSHDEETVECIELSRCELTDVDAATGTDAHSAADVKAIHVEVKQPPPPAPPPRRPPPEADDDAEVDEQPDYEARAAALARVARYTGAVDGRTPRRTLRLLAPSAAHAHLIRAHLTTLLRRPEPSLRIL